MCACDGSGVPDRTSLSSSWKSAKGNPKCGSDMSPPGHDRGISIDCSWRGECLTSMFCHSSNAGVQLVVMVKTGVSQGRAARGDWH